MLKSTRPPRICDVRAARARRRPIVVALLVVLAIGLVQVPIARAQTATGQLVVTTKDEAGAVVPGASIVVLNTGTDEERNATTGDSGGTTFPQLPVGLYTVSIEAAGFQKAVFTELKIDVGKDYALVAELKPGAPTEVVEITAGEALINTQNAELSTTVTKKQIQDLPLDGRDPLQLIQLQAGVTFTGRAGTTIDGMRASSTQITQDGINIQDNFIRSNATDFSPNRTTVSAVAEFSVTTSNGDVDSSGSSNVKLVTPSGTNELHGEIYEYHRNDALGANDFFNNANGVEKPQLIRNQFGGSVGGPIVIPNFYNGKDKLFFFANYEGFRERSSDGGTATVLTPLARQGIFTYFDNSGFRRSLDILRAKDVAIDPIVANLLTRVPTDINAIAGDGLNTGGYFFNKSTPSDRDQAIGRVDYNLNEHHSLEFVYQFTGETNFRSDIDTTYNSTAIGGDTGDTQRAVAAWHWNISNRLTNELRAGLNNVTADFFSNEDENIPYFVGLPLITNPIVTFQEQGRRTIISSLIDNAALSAGDHLIRFGGQVDQIRGRRRTGFTVIPVVNLGIGTATPSSQTLRSSNFVGGISASQLANANAMLSLLAGYVAGAAREYNITSTDSGFQAGVPEIRNVELNQFSFYGSDQWRVHPRVTLNAGMRYDYISPLKERDNLALLPVRSGNQTGAELILDPGGTLDFTDGYYFNPDRNNFAPNVGVAWDVFGDGRTVVRGGYIQAYINDEAVRAVDAAGQFNPGLTTTINTGAIFGHLAEDAGTILSTRLAPPEFQVPVTFEETFASILAPTFYTVDPDFKTPKYHEWNFSVEREIGWDTAVSLRYVGNKGVDLARTLNYNQIDVISNGFAEDVARARQNGFLAERANPNGGFNPAYNPNIPGSQPLRVFPMLASGGFLSAGVIREAIATGEAGLLAIIYLQNRLNGQVDFVPNTNAFLGLVLTNKSSSDYHAFQAEVRKRFSHGLFFQANYTWSKALTDSSGTSQLKLEYPSDLNNLSLDRRRALFDTPHTFRVNAIYELPFGDGKRWEPKNGILTKLASGWQVSSILYLYSGEPLSITSQRFTFNNLGRTANTSLTREQINDLLGVYYTPEGVYFIDPSVIGEDGRAVAPDGEDPFAGQVFFNPGPGEVGDLQGLQFNGPTKFVWDGGIIKRTAITERVGLEFRLDAFNVLNTPIFFFPASPNINDPNFGRLTSTFTSPRVMQLAARITF
jgi:hypothetical protein